MHRPIVVSFLGILMSFAVTAAEPPAKPEAPPAANKPADENAGKSTDAQAPKPAGDAKAAGKDTKPASTPQRFVPSEQVRPDFDVSFPVDI